jgi:hypothetical protein
MLSHSQFINTVNEFLPPSLQIKCSCLALTLKLAEAKMLGEEHVARFYARLQLMGEKDFVKKLKALQERRNKQSSKIDELNQLIKKMAQEIDEEKHASIEKLSELHRLQNELKETESRVKNLRYFEEWALPYLSPEKIKDYIDVISFINNIAIIHKNSLLGLSLLGDALTQIEIEKLFTLTSSKAFDELNKNEEKNTDSAHLPQKNINVLFSLPFVGNKESFLKWMREFDQIVIQKLEEKGVPIDQLVHLADGLYHVMGFGIQRQKNQANREKEFYFMDANQLRELQKNHSLENLTALLFKGLDSRSVAAFQWKPLVSQHVFKKHRSVIEDAIKTFTTK